MTAPSPTLAALLALLDEREPLDVGPCPACVERGGGHIWSQRDDREWPSGPGRWLAKRGPGGGRVRRVKLRHWSRPTGQTLPADQERHTRDVISRWVCIEACPECSEPGPEVECESEHGYVSATGVHYQTSHAAPKPCPDCDGTGKRPGPPQPTGRDRRTPGQALRDALGLRWSEVHSWNGPRRGAEAIACNYTAEQGWRTRVTRLGEKVWSVEALFPAAVDPAARTPLQPYADELQARGDILGQAIALALAGECRECEGAGCIFWPPTWSDPGGDESPCPKCNGEGAAVGELAHEVRVLAEALDVAWWELLQPDKMPAKEPAPA